MAADRLGCGLALALLRLSISPTSAATDLPSARAMVTSASQKSFSSETDVRWRAMVSERLLLGRAMLESLALRADHVLGPYQTVEFLLEHMAEPNRLLAQGGAALMRGLGDLARLVVADMRRKRRHQHERLLQMLLDAVPVGLDADDAFLPEAVGDIGEKPDGLQHGVSDHRLEYVRLEMPLASGKGDRRVVAHDLRRHHGHRLALGGVDLARHDR